MTRKTQTVIRTALLLLTLLNTALQGMGAIDFGNETVNNIYRVIGYIALAGSAAWAWWKNNSVTENAKEADKYLDLLKATEDGRDPSEIGG